MKTKTLPYCGNLVRESDPDRFLVSLFAPEDSRESIWALFAFNHEIAKTREVVNETQLGLIRLQWWREAIGAVYDGAPVPQHDVMQALAGAIKRHDLKRDDFETLLYAREFDLEEVLPASLEGLLNYAEFTSFPLMKLASACAGIDGDVEPLRQVAVNYALAGLIRAVPFHAGQGRCYLPQDMMNVHGVRVASLYAGKPESGLRDILRAVDSEILRGLRIESPFLRAAQTTALIYMRRLRALNFDVFGAPAIRPPAFAALRVTWGALSRGAL